MVDDLEIPVFPQPVGLFQRKGFSHVKKAAKRLLRGQRFTAFSAPTGDDVAAGVGFHSAAKAVYLFALAALGLISL